MSSNARRGRSRSFRACPALLLAAAAGLAEAQSDYPVKPVRIVLPFATGGAADFLARAMGQRLQDAWKTQIVVDSRQGAGGIIATEVAAKAPPDGYTFLIVTVGHAVNPSLYPTLPYDTLRDFTAVGIVGMTPNVLVVHPSVPAKNVRELIALAKAHPGALMYGSGGIATTGHVAAAMFISQTGVNLEHVPYKGAQRAVQDVVAGRISVMLDQVASSLNWINQGRLRPLAVTPAKRTPQLPEVPTIAESGVPGYDFTAWWMLLAPAKTPPEIVARFNAELLKARADPGFRDQIARVGADPAPAMTPAETNDYLRSEIARWSKVVKAVNMKAE